MNARNLSPAKISVAFLGACLLAGSVFAEPPRPHAVTQSVSRTIDIAGLDLSSPKGVERLYREIVTIAEQVCAADKRRGAGVAQAREHERARRCAEQAIDAALLQVAAATGFEVERLTGVERSKRAPFASAR